MTMLDANENPGQAVKSVSRLLLAGAWRFRFYEPAMAQAFRRLGVDVAEFRWGKYFDVDADPEIPRKHFGALLKKAQNKFLLGPLVNKLNTDLLSAAVATRPDALFVNRGAPVFGSTLRHIKEQLGCVIVGYNNDDPFSDIYPAWQWRHFRTALPHYDIMFAYRPHNIKEYINAGAGASHLLRSWYIPEENTKVDLGPLEEERFGCDAVFIGHYEPDGRLQALEALAREGIRVRVFGNGWNGIVTPASPIGSNLPIKPVMGNDYNSALCGAKIGICFLSKLNRDSYTRRCFEIPATETFLLSEYSDDLSRLFAEGLEAEFFRSEAELVAKAKRYIRDNDGRQKIARAGRERVLADGHDVTSRMKGALGQIGIMLSQSKGPSNGR